ncbi:MAG: alanine racemase [Bacteroidota bacterium]
MNLTKPTLLLDPRKVKENIAFMKEKADQHTLDFRPHFKTHQSKMIGEWFKEQGVKKITVSSVEMAKYFAKSGWNDILIAFPLNINEIKDINKLSSSVNLYLTIENKAALTALERELINDVGIYIKIDAGYGRTGIDWRNTEEIKVLAEKTEKFPKTSLTGLLIHSGHTYQANSTKEITEIHRTSINKLSEIRKHLKKDSHSLKLSIGDTPGCSIADEFYEADEIRPGNFVFYDLQQYKSGACKLEDIAICLACPIVAKHENKSTLIIYGGAVHFSKEYLMEGEKPIYGYGIKLSDEGWIPWSNKMLITKLSQEHGTITVTPEIFNKFNIGDFIGFLPVHSCLTANLMGEYIDFSGNKYDHLKGQKF